MLKLVSGLLIGWFGLVASAASHTFFVGTTDIAVNPYTGNTEIIHRFTSLDLETLLSDRYQLRISADSDQYQKLVKQYVENGFSLTEQDGTVIAISWIGIDPGINDTYIYQEVTAHTVLKGIMINHQLLTDYFPNQKNRLNYQSAKIKGSLLFDGNTKQAVLR